MRRRWKERRRVSLMTLTLLSVIILKCFFLSRGRIRVVSASEMETCFLLQPSLLLPNSRRYHRDAISLACIPDVNEQHDKKCWRMDQSCSRRNVLRKISRAVRAASILASWDSFGRPNAASAEGLPLEKPSAVAEALRKSAATIPGYGLPDVYFPSSIYGGRWRATKTIVASEDPRLAPLLPLEVSYDYRFIQPSSSVETVVADRAFNEQSYRNALAQKLQDFSASVRSTTWDVSNPNVLTLFMVDDAMLEIRVTKRAATSSGVGGGRTGESNNSNSEDASLVSSSEFRRVITTDGGGEGAIPKITASRVLTKWKQSDTNVLEAIELVYKEPLVVADPLAGGGARPSQDGPTLESKSKLRLVREESGS